MGSGGLRRFPGPHLLAEGTRVLRPGAALAQRQAARFRKIRVKVFLYFIGKPKDTHANAMAEDFMSRAARYAKAEMREIRPDRFDPWERHATARKILLDPAGREIDSKAFA